MKLSKDWSDVVAPPGSGDQSCGRVHSDRVFRMRTVRIFTLSGGKITHFVSRVELVEFNVPLDTHIQVQLYDRFLNMLPLSGTI